jgi:glycosyltransferase 2 family protein
METGPVRRHPWDIGRVVLGCIVLLSIGPLALVRPVPRWEVGVFRVFNHLPGFLYWPIAVVMQAGSLGAVPVAGGVALAARRPRLARDLATAGFGAYLLAQLVKAVVERGRPEALIPGVILRGATQAGLGFPSGHAAVAAALATAAAPHLGRLGRRLAWAVALLVAVARLYVGAHLPIDVLGGIGLGWAVGAATHLLWGAPVRMPSTESIRRGLGAAGLRATSVLPASLDARGSNPFLATTEDGRQLFVKSVGREQRDADLLFKAWRHLVLRRLEDESPFATPKQQVEHEAYLSMVASRAGVLTPTIVATSETGHGTFLLVEELIDGTPLDALAPADVTDQLLNQLWTQVGLLRSARIAHRDLRLANVLVDREGRPWLIDFGFAEASATDHRLALDVAELLACTAVKVGPDRAVACALSELGPGALETAAPLLQGPALSAQTRHEIRSRPHLLEALRDRVGQAVGARDVQLEMLVRLRLRTLVLLLAAGFGIHLLLPQVGELRRTLDAVTSASLWWLVAGLLASAWTYLAAATAQIGAAPIRLGLGRTIGVQLAASFANRLAPSGIGGMGVNIRYLQREGLPTATATSAVTVVAGTGFVLHVLALAATAIFLSRARLGHARIPRGWPVLIAVASVLAVAGIVMWIPPARRRLIVPVRSAVLEVSGTLRRPSQAARLVGGSAAVTAGYILSLAACLAAFGAGATPLEVTAVYLGGSAVAAISPTPGGLGAMEAALVAGLTGLGVASGPAIAGVLAFRLLTFWLPILPGWVCFQVLRRRHVI